MIGKKKKAAIGFLGVAMTAALSLTMLPSTASAVESDPSLDNLVMNKTVQLEDDGTYTINLEAYAKGQVSTETVKRVIPADIVLVLDQSGSMHDDRYPIDGIPSDVYTQVTDSLTNGQVADGNYYYEVGGNYYPVTAERETTGVEIRWRGQDGIYYDEEDLAYSWTRKHDGMVYNTATPFVADSLQTYTRTRGGPVGVSVYYVNDEDENDTTYNFWDQDTSAAGAREHFEKVKKTSTNTIEFHNDGGNFGNWDQDNPYYVAAVYTAVTQEEVRTYQYTYSYTDENGQQVIIGTSEGSDSDPCTVSPLYTRGTTSGYRLDALKYAADRFIDSIRSSAIANDVDHRVAVVGFGSDEYQGPRNEYYYSNTELFIGANQYNYAADGRESTYNSYGNLAADHYDEAFQSVNTSQGYQNLQASVNALAGKGATYPSLGFEMANGIYASNDNSYTTSDGTKEERSRIVVFLTDGEPGDDGYNSAEAQNTINQVNTTKNTYGATVYTVAVLDDSPSDSRVDTFLKNTSSNGSYTLATSTEALDDFFQTVDEDINNATTTVTLSENSILVDRLSEYFTVPKNFSITDNVTVQIAQHTGYDAFANPTAAPEGVEAVLSTNADGTIRGVTVRGFNFVSDENLVTTDVSSGGSTIATGNKLVVTITGVLAKDEAATNTYIDTNLEQSGIWDTDEEGTYGMVKAFNMPTTRIAEKSYVLDYAKEAELNVFDTSANRLDSASDSIFSEVGEAATSLTGTYGNSAVASSKLTYTPSTMNWNGYDTFYALGKDAAYGDSRTDNMWAKVNVIPANNVYYEDDFTTSTSTGTVGIEYNGNWSNVTDGSQNSGTNTETPITDTDSGDTVIHGGWKNGSLADDKAYSDGTAHMLETGATATFTFTGTGVDVYSRTNMHTGMVLAELYNGEGTDTMNMSKFLVVDNSAQSGDYYQIPTVSFTGLDYGTYTVKLTVGAKGNNNTYYLDGIRVYNPLAENTDDYDADQTVNEAYGDEAGAVFMEVRDHLLTVDETGDLDPDAMIQGAVFLDQNSEGQKDVTSSVGEYYEYGPKNEVYLAPEQAITFAILDADKVCVGLKAPAGTTKAAVVNGSADETTGYDINAASDLYYEVTPYKVTYDDGSEISYVYIRNDGPNLLSVTKLKTTGTAEFASVSLTDVISYSNTFAALPVVDYTDEIVDDDQSEAIEPSNPSDSEEGDVVIDNPDETPDQGNTPEQNNPITTWVNKLINGFLSLFGRW